MSTRSIYIDFNKGTLTNSGMARVVGYPTIIYGSDSVWEIHLVAADPDTGIAAGVDVTSATAWHAAVDTDFTQSTTPMIRTLDPQIDHSQAASGIISVQLNALTENFLAKVDGKQSIPAYFELRGLDSNDKTIYCYQIRINALGAVDAEGGEPIPVASGGVTLSDVYAVVRQTPLLQYSLDGTSWHDTQIDTDKLARVSVSGGDWSDAIMLPSGAQGPVGPSGAQGPKGDDGSIITGVQMSVLASDASGWVTFESGLLDFGIPSGLAGAPGPSGATGPSGAGIDNVVVTCLPSDQPLTSDFQEGVLYLGIPSGAPGAAGGDFISCATSGDMSAALVNANLGKVAIYTGETDSAYTKNHLYLIEAQESGSGTDVISVTYTGSTAYIGGVYNIVPGTPSGNQRVWTNGHYYIRGDKLGTNTWVLASTSGFTDPTGVIFSGPNYMSEPAPTTTGNWYDAASDGGTMSTAFGAVTYGYTDITSSGGAGGVIVCSTAADAVSATIADNVGQLVSYTGATSGSLIKNHVYLVTEVPGTDLIVTNCNTASLNDTYTLTDPTATGSGRIWTNGTYYIKTFADDGTKWRLGNANNSVTISTASTDDKIGVTGTGESDPGTAAWTGSYASPTRDGRGIQVAWSATSYSLKDLTPDTGAYTQMTAVSGGTVTLEAGGSYWIKGAGVVTGMISAPEGCFGECTIYCENNGASLTLTPSSMFRMANGNDPVSTLSGLALYRMNIFGVSIFGDNSVGVIETVHKP